MELSRHFAEVNEVTQLERELILARHGKGFLPIRVWSVGLQNNVGIEIKPDAGTASPAAKEVFWVMMTFC
jgi:hypothetical protein